ncbi:MAG TPA: tRNA epoxyqueuosine(34) reductase QueG [Chloroflexi bacterium]|nr:tRNA epoxyqueuosine(34) reductase QueG [Chloroflexota bacterium]
MKVEQIKDALKAEARRLGFQLVGVTTPDPPPHFNIFEGWLAAGHHAEMGWLAAERSRQRRADPRQILPECESILVLGMAYLPSPAGEGTGGEGKIASYAWGADYHEVLPPRLQALVNFIEEKVGAPVPNRWYTDTGPLLERDLAQRAGLGWIGKNTCLINPQAGSYFLLAEIVLGLALPPDEPFTPDHCGSCTRCLAACPTGCILPNRTLDANRCLSYLTIEHKGAIPPDLRPQIGNWIFGCDLCQQVCPWNQRFSVPSAEASFAPTPGVARPTLASELILTPQAFNRKFKGSPVKRAKRRGYLRNVAIALGNQADPAAIPALRAALSDPEPLVRGQAAWALGQIRGREALLALQAAAQTETDSTVQSEIQAALQNHTPLENH